MNRPRVRLTIGRLMILVLAASLASWGLFVAWPRSRGPTLAEQIAEAEYKQARLTREVAELADAEFSPGIDLQNVATIQGEAVLASSDMRRAIDRFQWSSNMHAKGFVSEATRIADGLTLARAGFDADQARDKLETVKKYANAKSTKASNGEVEKARADERVKLEAYRLERSRRLIWMGP
jgi:HlyD family secretion protein